MGGGGHSFRRQEIGGATCSRLSQRESTGADAVSRVAVVKRCVDRAIARVSVVAESCLRRLRALHRLVSLAGQVGELGAELGEVASQSTSLGTLVLLVPMRAGAVWAVVAPAIAMLG